MVLSLGILLSPCLAFAQTSALTPAESIDKPYETTAPLTPAPGGQVVEDLRQPQPADASASAAEQLTLEKVYQQVLENHPKLRGAGLQRKIAAAKRLEKQGAFDPVLSSGSDYLQYNSSSDKGKEKDATNNDMALEWVSRSGIKMGVGSRLNLGDVKSPLSPTGSSGEHFLGIKVPLLRGFLINEKSAAEQQAFIAEEQAEADLLRTRLELLAVAAFNYWDWVGAKLKVDVATNLLAIAQTRWDAVTSRVNAGDLPAIDAVEAQQEVQRRQGALVKAQRDFQKSTFKFSLYLWEASGRPSPLPDKSLSPKTIPVPVAFDEAKIQAGLKTAIEKRPELKNLNLEQDITEIDLRLAKNSRLPQLDLDASPGWDTGNNGVGLTMKAGVSFSVPFRQRTARGKIEAAKLKIEKLDLDTELEKQRIFNDILDAASAINTAYDRYLAARQELELAKTMESGERERFSLGDSTLFLVNQRERSTAEAANKLIDVQAEYEQAQALFNAITVQL